MTEIKFYMIEEKYEKLKKYAEKRKTQIIWVICDLIDDLLEKTEV